MVRVSFRTKTGKLVTFNTKKKSSGKRRTIRRRRSPVKRAKTKRTKTRRPIMARRRKSYTKYRRKARRGINLSLKTVVPAAVGYMGYGTGYASLISLAGLAAILLRKPSIAAGAMSYLGGMALRGKLPSLGGLIPMGNGGTGTMINSF